MKTAGSIVIIIVAVAIVVAILVFVRKRPNQTNVQTSSSVLGGNDTNSALLENPPAGNTNNNVTIEPMDTNNTDGETSNTTMMANGLEITILAKGTGTPAKPGDYVSVNYTGRLENGTVFDSNVDPKFAHVEPFTFQLGAGRVIEGWDTGVNGMQVGEKRRLVIPSELGYGARGAGSAIPPNATLVFDVEVIGIKN